MNLVLVNMSNTLDWEQGIVNRNFFVMKELVRSGKFDQVLLVDFLALNNVGFVFGWRRTLRYAWRSLWKRRGGVQSRFGFSHVLRAWSVPGLESKSRVHVLSGVGRPNRFQNDLNVLRAAMEMLQMRADDTIIWSYQAFAPDVLNFEARLRVFDAVDNWSQHASYKKQSEQLKKNYEVIGKKADLVFTVSDGLRELFPPQKAFWIPNGVDLDSFAGVQVSIPEDIQRLKKPVIGYVGTVQERIDFALVREISLRLPQMNFVFVGPVWAGVQAEVDALSKACANVHFLGRRPYHTVPAYLQAMDVCIIPHRIDEFIRSTNPMKLYDYLAAGKPVVTTPGAGTEVFANQISIVHTADDFVAAIQVAVNQNGAVDVNARLEAVQAHTWSSRVRTMRDLVDRAIV